MTTIIGIEIENRSERALEVQTILTKHGCDIKTRLGINDYKSEECRYNGLILIDVPNSEKADTIISEIKEIKNVTVKSMKF